MIGKKLADRAVSHLLSDLAGHDRFVFLDTSLPDHENRESLLFTQPIRQLRCRPGDSRLDFLNCLQHYLDRDYYLAGWFGYEFLHDHLPVHCGGQDYVIASLGVYKQPRLFHHDRSQADALPLAEPPAVACSYQLKNLSANMEQRHYCQAISRILDYIAAGDTYQVNYTFKFTFDFEGSISGFYGDLRRSQPVPFGACIKDGDDYILSFSPELFFRADRRLIQAKPMKGTMKRGRNTREDENLHHLLHNDEKNRSENVMIVDLLRNDLSHLVKETGGGSVNVTSLFDVERYQSVFQMTSSIVAQRLDDSRLTPGEILQALFPCGSVTGAPKIRTMEIIGELEKQPRGVYTGAIGYFSPAGKAVFNVPIRTVTVSGGRGEMGIGSGIVADSSPEDEWQECLLKAKFLTSPLPEFKLIETMLHDGRDGYLYHEDHLHRLQRSASYFNFPCDKEQLNHRLESLAVSFAKNGCHRVRLTLSSGGAIELTAAPCDPVGSLHLPDSSNDERLLPVSIGFAEKSTDSTGPWLFHKTTMRTWYDRAYERAQAAGLFDVIFCNERGEVTEGCITNIVILKDNIYFTPPEHCGLLGGVMRKQLLAGAPEKQVVEKVLSREEVLAADMIFLCNSLRGVFPARIQVNP